MVFSSTAQIDSARVDHALLHRIESVIGSISPDDRIGCVNATLCVRPDSSHPSVVALHCWGGDGKPSAETNERVMQLLHRHNVTGLWSGLDADAIYVRIGKTRCVPSPADVRAITRAVGHAFASLETQGLSTFTELTTCSGCEEQLLTELVRERGVETRGFVLYRGVDAEDLDATGMLRLRFGTVNAVSDVSARLVGAQTVAALRYHGLAVDWNGDVNQCIVVRLPADDTDGIPARSSCVCSAVSPGRCNFCCNDGASGGSGDCTKPWHCDECDRYVRCWDCNNCSKCF